MISENNLSKSLGVLIKDYRRQKGLTQAQLAKLVGLSTRHIGKLEDGTYIPKLSTYLNISKVLTENIAKICPAGGRSKDFADYKKYEHRRTDPCV